MVQLWVQMNDTYEMCIFGYTLMLFLASIFHLCNAPLPLCEARSFYLPLGSGYQLANLRLRTCDCESATANLRTCEPANRLMRRVARSRRLVD